MIQYDLYNAFSQLPLFTKHKLIAFISENAMGSVSPKMIQEAVDYATKEIPSFGGFVIIAREEEEIKGAVVVNKTGLNGGNPKHRVVFLTMHRKGTEEAVFPSLVERSVRIAKGDISLRMECDNRYQQVLQQLGFTPTYVEYHLTKPVKKASSPVKKVHADD